jgi:RNA ligase (TIGR02306 family)
MSNSTHQVIVYKLGPVQSVPEADRLDLWHIWNYTCLSQKGLHKEGDLVAFIPPDNIVPDTEEYAWLNGHRRIKAKKLRGVISYGLLVSAPEGAIEGEDVAERMGIVHYEPEIHGSGGPNQVRYRGPTAPAPPGISPGDYDVDALMRYSRVLIPGEMVWVTEKIHGSNVSVIHTDGALHVKSHHQWKVDSEGDVFWKAVRNTPGLIDWCEEHPELQVFGEIIPTQRAGGVEFNYGNTWNDHSVILFDIAQHGEFYSHELARGLAPNLPWVPTIDCVPFDLQAIEAMASGPSLVPGAKHIREGCIVTPVNERTHYSIGRIKLKLVSYKFLELK